MSQIRNFKEFEKKINETLYSNILLLSQFYPTRHELKTVLHKDMFLKCNKAAFMEVVYFLLYIINPEVLKQKLSIWPIEEIREESTFRKEILTYINELNLIYENQSIPLCQASTLLSSGGIKFAQLMFHISQLAIIQHLKRNEEKYDILPLKAIKEVPIKKLHVKHLKRNVDFLRHLNRELVDNFEKEFSEFNNKSLTISNAIEDIKAKISDASKLLEETQKHFVEKHPNHPSDTETEQQISQIKKQVDNLVQVNEILKSSGNFVRGIMKSSLEHNESTFVYPPEISHIITNKKELSLTEFYKGLTIVLKKKNMAIKAPSSVFLEESTIALAQLKSRYEDILNQLKDQENCITKLAEGVRNMFK